MLLAPRAIKTFAKNIYTCGMETIVLDEVTAKIVTFLRSINISVEFGEFANEEAFLPGISICKSGLLINSRQLKYPGDMLHEAGHIAVALPAKRDGFNGRLGSGTDEDIGEEMMAIAWSYAAAKHLGIDPHIVFHAVGYNGGGSHIAHQFAAGHFFGVSLLQWIGLTYEAKKAAENNIAPYPHMIKWLRE
jgi:hypothetical protein